MRHAIAIIPLFVAALLAQIYAPVGASLAMRTVAGVAPICASHPAPDRSAPDRSAPHAPPCCDLCAFVASGAAPVPPVLAPFAFHRPEPRRAAWTNKTRRVVIATRRATAQARAPPFAS